MNDLANISNKNIKDALDNLISSHAVLSENKVTRITLFGSYARGDQNENSDLDLFIEYSEDAKDENGIFKGFSNNIFRFIRKLSYDHKVEIDILMKSWTIDPQKNTKLFQNIEREGMTIWERGA